LTAFRLAHLSDIHFGGENAAATAGALQVLQAEAFDLVVLSGDLTRFGEVEELRSAAAWIAQIPQPKLVTPGLPTLAEWSCRSDAVASPVDGFTVSAIDHTLLATKSAKK